MRLGTRTRFSAAGISLVAIGACCAPLVARAAIRPFGGAGVTTFSGSAVHGVSSYTGFGAGLGVDFGSRSVAVGARADFSYLGAGGSHWVQVYLAHLRVFLAANEWRWRPYAEVGAGGGGAGDLLGSPGYAAGAGGGILYETGRGPALFLDVRSVWLGSPETDQLTMVMIRAGLMK
jgi:hypothetical protein